MKINELLISIAGFAAPLSMAGAVVPGVNQFYTSEDGVKYEVLDFERHTLGVSGLAEGAADFLMLPSEVGVSGQFIYEGSRLTLENEKFTVVQINANAFAGKSNLFYVQFPSTLTDIGDRAFSDCTLLTFDSFPEGLQTIGDSAFKGCASVTKISLPESVTDLGKEAFANMSGLMRVVMQNCGVTEIKAGTFENDKEINELYLPLAVKSIGDRAFFNTLSLTELYFPEGLETIGQQAFCGQSYAYGGYAGGLDRIELPSTLKEIGTRAFAVTPLFMADLSKCTSLTEISSCAFQYSYNLSTLVLPEGLEKIGDNAFESCGGNASVGMIDVVVPSTVKEIGTKAFDTKIVGVTVGDEVTTLTASSLGTPNMMELGSGIKSIAVNAFKTENLRLIRLHAPTPPSFSGTFNLTDLQMQAITVILDDGTKNLYDRHPVWSRFNLVERSASEVSVELAGNTSLADEIYLASGVMPSRVTSLTVSGTLSDNDLSIIKENMFSLTRLDLSKTTLTEIPENCFKDMTLLTEVVLPESLKIIWRSAFEGCRSMHLTELPDGITRIDRSAFEDCSAITVSKLPDALEYLGYSAFSDCTSLRSIVAGPNLSGSLQAVFFYCRLLEYADFSASKVTDFNANILQSCQALRTVLLPETLEKIGHRAFYNSGIRNITIPGSVKSIDEEAFFGTPLRAISLGEGITEIPNESFSNCYYLVTASFPSTTKSVGSKLFINSPRLRMLSCAAVTAPQAASGAFEGVLTQKSTLTIPKQSFSSYLSAPQWGQFANFDCSLDVSVPSNVEVTVVPEEDYQDILEQEELLMEQEENSQIPGESAPARKARREAVRKASEALVSGKQFARVFNGASIRSTLGENSKGYRYFVNGTPGIDYEAIYLNDVDITSQVVDGMLLLPADAAGSLRIVGDDSGVSEVTADGDILSGEECDAYSLTGIKVYAGVYGELPGHVAPGVYVVRTASGKVQKISVK